MGEITCYFHMGIGKTGTSAIQAFLDINRKMLVKEQHCLYPNVVAIRPNLGQQFNHGILFNPNDPHFKSDEDRISKLLQVINFARRKKISTIVFSFEAIFDWLDHYQTIFERIGSLEDVSIKGIVYFRRQDHYFSSVWKQWGIKSDYKNIEEFIQKNDPSHWYQNARKFESWAGPGSLIIKAYEKQQLPGGLIPDFLRTIGADPDAAEWKTPQASNRNVNPGFSRDVLEYLHLTKDLAEGVHDNTLFDLVFESLGKNYQKLPFEKYDFLSPSQQIEILDKYAEMNRKIAVEFLGREDGRLFLEPYPDPNEPWTPYPGLSVEALAQILTGVILHQQKKSRFSINDFIGKVIRKIRAVM